MKQEDKLWEEYTQEIDKKNPKRIFSAKVSLGWNSEMIPFYKALLLWAYKRGLRNRIKK